MNNFKRFGKGIQIEPGFATDPLSGRKGEIFWQTTLDTLRVNITPTYWRNLLLKAGTSNESSLTWDSTLGDWKENDTVKNGTYSLYGKADIAVDGIKAADLAIQASNKLFGTGDGGNLLLKAGSSLGGAVGQVVFQASLIDAGVNRIINVVNPVLDQDAATKFYVDDAVSKGGAMKIIGGGTISTATSSNVTTAILSSALNSAALSGDGIGQTFLATQTGKLVSVAVELQGSNPGNYYNIDIYETDGVNPIGSPIATSDDFDAGTLTGSFSYAVFTYTAPPALVSGITYFFHVRAKLGSTLTGFIRNDGEPISQVEDFDFTGLTGAFFDVVGPAKYLQLADSLAYVWFNVTDGSNIQTDPGGVGVSIQVDILIADTASVIALAAKTAIDTAAVVSATSTALGVLSVTYIAGLLSSNGSAATSGTIFTLFTVGANGTDYYADGTRFDVTTGPVFSPTTTEDVNFQVIVTDLITVSRTSNMYLEVKGLDYSDNTILTASPIELPEDGYVSYVIPNLTAGGPALTPMTSTLPDVPANAIIVARREGSDVIVGSSSTRLKNGQSTKIYQQSSNQTLSYIGAPDAATALPTYSSNNYILNTDSLTTALGKIDLGLSTVATNFATKELDNLGTTAINASLFFDADNAYQVGSNTEMASLLYTYAIADSNDIVAIDIPNRTLRDINDTDVLSFYDISGLNASGVQVQDGGSGLNTKLLLNNSDSGNTFALVAFNTSNGPFGGSALSLVHEGNGRIFDVNPSTRDMTILNNLKVTGAGGSTGDALYRDASGFIKAQPISSFNYGALDFSTGVDVRIGGPLIVWATGGAPNYLELFNTANTQAFQQRAHPTTPGYAVTWPQNQGASNTYLRNDGSGNLTWVTVSGGANTSLSNLSSVAVNTAILPASDNGIDFGSTLFRWADMFATKIRDNSNNIIINLQQRFLVASDNTPSTDFNNRYLQTSTGLNSIDWSSDTRTVLGNSLKFKNLAADPSGQSGDVYFNNVSNVLRFFDGSAWNTLSSGGVTFPLLAPAGSAGAPSYSFSGDPDTGMYQSGGANTIGFTTGGGLKWQIFNSGHFRPGINNSYDLGDTSFWVRDGYIAQNLYFKLSQDYAIRSGATTLPSGNTIDFHMSVIGGNNGNLGTFTNDSTNGAGRLYFETGNASGSSITKIALIGLKTGNHTNASNTATTGGVSITTGNNSGTGAGANSGDISFVIGTVTGSGIRGKVSIDARILDLTNAPIGSDITFENSVARTIAMGSVSSAGSANGLTIQSTANNGSGTTGLILIKSAGSISASTGAATFGSGNTTGSGKTSGATLITSGNTVNAASGDTTVASGNATGGGDSGNVSIKAGTVTTGIRGKAIVDARQLDVTAVTEGLGLPIWHKYTISESAFTAASSTENIELFQLPAKASIHNIIIKHTTSFTGGSVTSFTLSVGVSGNLTKYASAYDVFQATGASNHQASNTFDMENYGAATSIRLTAVSAGGNVADVTAGTVEVYVLWGILP
jgi:hypothetical protein